MTPPGVAVFAPNPLLTVTLEREGEERESIHFHAGGQGVWVASMALCMGATPVLCSLLGGEPGELLRPLIEKATGAPAHLVRSASASGCYVTDRRSGERQLLSMSLSDPPSRHELDELFSLTCAQALACGWLVVTNPLPGESLPLEVYRDLVADARAGGCSHAGGPVLAAPGQRAGGRTRPGEDQRLGAGRVRARACVHT